MFNQFFHICNTNFNNFNNYYFYIDKQLAIAFKKYYFVISKFSYWCTINNSKRTRISFDFFNFWSSLHVIFISFQFKFSP